LLDLLEKVVIFNPFVEGKYTVDKPELVNADEPMLVTLAGMVIEVKLVAL